MSNSYLKLGTHNAICDVCGFEFKADELRKTWDNQYVCETDFEPRHPSDFFRGREEDTSVEFTRPDSAESGGTDIEGSTYPPTRSGGETTPVPSGHNDGDL